MEKFAKDKDFEGIILVDIIEVKDIAPLIYNFFGETKKYQIVSSLTYPSKQITEISRKVYKRKKG